jgi:hypothetical protein
MNIELNEECKITNNAFLKYAYSVYELLHALLLYVRHLIFLLLPFLYVDTARLCQTSRQKWWWWWLLEHAPANVFPLFHFLLCCGMWYTSALHVAIDESPHLLELLLTSRGCDLRTHLKADICLSSSLSFSANSAGLSTFQWVISEV